MSAGENPEKNQGYFLSVPQSIHREHRTLIRIIRQNLQAKSTRMDTPESAGVLF